MSERQWDCDVLPFIVMDLFWGMNVDLTGCPRLVLCVLCPSKSPP